MTVNARQLVTRLLRRAPVSRRPGSSLYVAKRGGRFLKLRGEGHIAAYAPTRSGKGVGLVIPNALTWPGSLLCLDPKGETFKASASARVAMGQRVFLFDPLAQDSRTARYNPLTYVRRGTVDAFTDILRIAQMFFPHIEGDGNAGFFQDCARSAFAGVAAFVGETPGLPFTIGEVFRLLSRHDGPPYMIGMIDAGRAAGRPYTLSCVNALQDYLKGSVDQVNAIRKTVTAALGLWNDPRVDAATSESDFDLRRIRHEPMSIYVGATAETLAMLQPLMAVFFQQVIDLNVRVLPELDGSRHEVLFLLDEFPLLGRMPMLAKAFAFVAGYWFRMMLIMQSKAQLRDPKSYGRDMAETILDNCELEVIFGTKSHEVAKELSERIGQNTEEGRSLSGPRFWAGLQQHRQNEHVSQQRRLFVLPQEIVRLSERELIMIRAGMLPIMAERLRYFLEPHFTELEGPPPEVPAISVTLRFDDRPIADPEEEPTERRKPARKKGARTKQTKQTKPAKKDRKTPERVVLEAEGRSL